MNKILPGLTTTAGSNWSKKIEEIKKYKIKEIALFPTVLEIEERKKLYTLIEKAGIRSIPHIHLRDGMERWEIEYFKKEFQTKVFNIHNNLISLSLLKICPEFKNQIFIENTFSVDNSFIKSIQKCGGICFDVSHFHSSAILQKNKSYQKLLVLFKKYSIGCCHISAITKEPYEIIDYRNGSKKMTYSAHYLNNLSELDYVKDYKQYLPHYISIELENSFEEQLEIKKYLEKLIS